MADGRGEQPSGGHRGSIDGTNREMASSGRHKAGVARYGSAGHLYPTILQSTTHQISSGKQTQRFYTSMQIDS